MTTANSGAPASRSVLRRTPCALAFALATAPAFAAEQAQEETGREAVAAPGDPGARLDPALRDRLARWHPDGDDWTGEGRSQAAQQRLGALVAAWRPGRATEASALAELLAPEFAGTALRPAGLEPAFDDGVFRVLRSPAGAEAPPATARGVEGFRAALDELLLPFRGGDAFDAKLKIFTVEEREGALLTRAAYSARGIEARGGARLQQQATWICEWTLPADGAPPLLRSVRVEGFEEVRGPAGGGPLLADCTESLFGNEEAFRAQLLPSMGFWQGRLDGGLGFSDQSHQGVAIGDVDGDGLEDLFLPQPGGLPNLLFLRRPDGTLRDHSAAAGVDFLDATRSALLLDLDNDGDLDLVMNLGPELVFLSNDGAGRFTVETSGHAPEITSLAAADYDGDGFLDVYVCRYLNPYEDQAVPTPYHDAENGLDNALLRFTGDWKIEDVTAAVGLDVNNRRFSFAASWEDYDNDGDQDLYVANDFGRNNLYRNDGGRFTDVAAAAGVEDVSAGMGVTWGDYDRDGWMDLYVSNMYSSAGNRVAYQRAFLPGADARLLGEVRRHARGNSLFRNRGDGGFADATLDARVHRGRWAWGSVFADLNHDGWPDLVVPNGFVTNDRADDL